MNFYRERALSAAASNLIEFDADSIRQLVSAQRGAHPDVWLADPDAYEKNGRLLRDTETPRMLAYSTKDQVLYATDGCNACSRNVPKPLPNISEAELKQFAEENEFRLELLQALVEIARS